MSKKREVKEGEKFGRYSILKELKPNKYRQRIFLCECQCGTIKEVQLQHLVSGRIKSCGCITKIHGMSQTRFYHIWKGAQVRCENPNGPDFNRYGGRGIKFNWSSFEEFRDDMYISYLKHCEEFGEKNTTIDRIDGEGNYDKDNCRWATRKIQSINKPSTIIYKGKSLSEWCKILDIKYNTARDRIKNRGKSIEEALGFNNNKEKEIGK